MRLLQMWTSGVAREEATAGPLQWDGLQNAKLRQASRCQGPLWTKTGSSGNFICNVYTSASKASLRNVRKQNSSCRNRKSSMP